MSIAVSIPAQTAPTSTDVLLLEAVSVTSQKRVQEIQEVPIPVTAYTDTALEVLSIRQYKDLAPFVPGFMVQEQSPNNPGINIRGVTTDSGDPRSKTRVSLFQDGVSISRSRASVVELFDLERVEVRKARCSAAARKSVRYRSSKRKLTMPRKPVSLWAPATTAARSWRACLTRRASPTPCSVASPSLPANVTATLKTSPTTPPSTVRKPRRCAAPCAGSQSRPPRSTLFSTTNGTPLPARPSRAAPSPLPVVIRPPYTFAALNRGRELLIDRSVWGATLLIDHELTPAWSLSSITGWREYDSFEQFDTDGSFVNLLEFAEDASGEQFSQEFRLNFDNDGPFIGFVGTGYFHEEGTQRVPFYASEQQI
ncbi:MAG: TonB-dependent receptor [Candidatus Synoicihabitans palmerolidicus]|nr:TonB-dependent receptor [Candidatus Synoicihabitans palmerolidicus]